MAGRNKKSHLGEQILWHYIGKPLNGAKPSILV